MNIEQIRHDNAIENLEWCVQNNAAPDDLEESISEWENETLDHCLIYTNDIIDIWREMGMPEPIDSTGSITGDMAYGIAENIDSVDIDRVVEFTLENHSELSTEEMWDAYNNSEYTECIQLLTKAVTKAKE